MTHYPIDKSRCIDQDHHIDESECYSEVAVSRVQLALNVADIDAAVEFYSKLFGAEPAKRRPGYANFAITKPPLKLVLIEGQATPGTMNHLGVEVASTDEVAAAQSRLAAAGLATATEDNVTCCYAVQDKVWVDDPDGAPWEIYTVLADAEMSVGKLRTADPGEATACCGASPAAAESACCLPPGLIPATERPFGDR
jgi:catechol 2,3-dioxygenase-like lactoylglutathione lyase family enzyme